MQQIQLQNSPSQQEQIRAVIWQGGTIKSLDSLETLQAIPQNPPALVWLDITGDCGRYSDILRNTFQRAHITLQTMCEEAERAKFTERENYFYLVMHGLSFDAKTGDADTPKLDIVFGKDYLITAHR